MPAAISVGQLVFGVLGGPFVLAFVGGWLGGDADPADIRDVIGWSYAPFAVAGLAWIPLLVVYGGGTAWETGP